MFSDHFLRKQFCLSNNNKQEMQIRQKNRGKRDKREGRNCRLGLACSHVKGLFPPLPSGSSTRPGQPNVHFVFIVIGFLLHLSCSSSSRIISAFWALKRSKKITTLLTGLTRSKMYAIIYILYKPYCGPYKCSLRGHRNSYLALAKFWQRTHAKTITPAMQATKN